jgi:CNT family concentrative nucleoside transporter
MKNDTPGSLAPTPLSWRIAIVATVLIVGGLTYALGTVGVVGPRGQATAGIVCFIGLIAACSSNLRAVNWTTIAWGIGLQFLFALFVLKFRFTIDGEEYQPGLAIFRRIGDLVSRFLAFSDEGSKFVFGALADRGGAMQKTFGPADGFVFAFRALPTIIFVSSFFAVLFHLGVLQFIVRMMARVMMFLMRTSGAETLSAAANVFMGQTEAPLIVKPYVAKMTTSELLAMMVGGMATISGGVMAVYIQMGANPVAILATSVMAAPAGLYLSKLLLPETGRPLTSGATNSEPERPHANVVDAASGGASDGLQLALNVGAMLIAFLAFLAMFDALLGSIKPLLISYGVSPNSIAFWPDDLSLTMIFSWVFAPVAYLMGVEPADVPRVASLLGTKLIGNEFIAYVDLTSKNLANGQIVGISDRSYKLATYALTGFANIASIGIQIGGIGAMAPERRKDLARLGPRALLAGFVATLVNASFAGLLM